MPTSVTARTPAWLDGATVSAAEMRAAIPGVSVPYAGIVRGLNAAALPTPAMKVRLPAGICEIDDGQNGYVPLELASTTDLDIAPSSATQTRYDSVIAEVVDNGDATSLWRFRVLTGTPSSGTPTPPSLPPADQPTAKTLRLANVFVQANAETNGFVRAQDVTVTAKPILSIARPQQTTQLLNIDNTSPAVNVWTDFTAAQWPPVTFVVPSSGLVYVSVGADAANLSTVSSYTSVGWRMSGGYTLAADFPRAVTGSSPSGGTRRALVTGMTSGVTVTVTPAYRMSALTASRYVHSGVLIVEPV